MEENDAAKLLEKPPKSKLKKLLVYSPWLLSVFYILLNSGIWIYEFSTDIPNNHDFQLDSQIIVQEPENVENEQTSKQILRLSKSGEELKNCTKSSGFRNRFTALFSQRMVAAKMTLEIKNQNEKLIKTIELLETANCYVNHNPPTGPILRDVEDFNGYSAEFFYIQTVEPYSKRPVWSLIKYFDKSVEFDDTTWQKDLPNRTDKYDKDIWFLKNSGSISLEANKKYSIEIPLNVGKINYVLSYITPKTADEPAKNSRSADSESILVSSRPNQSEQLNPSLYRNDTQADSIQACHNWVDSELRCSVRWFIRQWYDGVDENQRYGGKLYENISVLNEMSFGSSPTFLQSSNVNNNVDVEMNTLRTSSTPLLRDANGNVNNSNNDNRWYGLEWIDRNNQKWVKITAKLRDHNNDNIDAFYNIYFMVKDPTDCRSSFNDKVTNYESVDECLIEKISFEQISAVN